MGFPVYDFRTDIRNLLVTPQIRSRFLRMEPGQSSQGHTHDLGHEIFLILAGQCEFTIDGETEILSPGQLCVALTDQMHSVRVVGDEPMIMYLSVTPHIQPTHTFWTEAGTKQPPRFAPHAAYDIEIDHTVTVPELIDRQVAAAQALAAAAQANAERQAAAAARLKQAVAAGDQDTASAIRNEMWDALFTVFDRSAALGDIWNELAPRAVQ